MRSDGDSWDISTGVGSTALRKSGFGDDEPSAWIAEGLLIYLPAAAPLAGYLCSLNRPVPAGDIEVADMISSITLVTAVKG